jgi:perosamine synthetase
MIPLSTPDLRGRELEYLSRCVDDNWVSSAGPFVREIETRIAKMFEVPFAVATVNGTTALELALRASGIGRGDAVIVPDWSFAATVNAVIHAGAEPVFADISTDNLTIDPMRAEEAFGAGDKRIRAVIAVYTLGRAPNLAALLDICRAKGAALIEDAAGAFGAVVCDRAAGCHGDVGIFSFNGNKIVTAGGGGMIVTDNEMIARRARHLSQQARSGDDYTYDDVGFNYRMTNVNAAIGLAQLERFDEMRQRRLEIEQRYDAGLFPSNRLQPLPRAAWDPPYCWLYSLRCQDGESARSLVAVLHDEGIEARRFWRALSEQAPYSGCARFGGSVAAGVSGTVVSLPCSSHLINAQQDRVIKAVKGWERLH